MSNCIAQAKPAPKDGERLAQGKEIQRALRSAAAALKGRLRLKKGIILLKKIRHCTLMDKL